MGLIIFPLLFIFFFIKVEKFGERNKYKNIYLLYLFLILTNRVNNTNLRFLGKSVKYLIVD